MLQKKSVKIVLTFIVAIIFGAAGFWYGPQILAGVNDNTSGWAWSENIGWISFNSTGCDADGDGFSDGACGEPSSAGLVGHWKFDDGVGSPTAADSSGNGNDGTLIDMDPATDWVPGQIGGALDFDGVDGKVTIGSPPSLENINTFTYCAWINPRDAGGGDEGMIVNRESSEAEKKLGYANTNPDTMRLSVDRDITNALASFPEADVPTNQWQHLCGTYSESDGPRLYHNGVEVSYTARVVGSGTTNDDSTTSLVIGDRAGSPGPEWNGLIDDVRIYNRALSEEEIADLYSVGAGLMPVSPYGVDVDLNTGDFSGYAWSSNIGWIKLDPSGTPPGESAAAPAKLDLTAGGTDCGGSQYDVCGWARACVAAANPGACEGTTIGSWVQETPGAQWEGRSDHTSLVFNDGTEKLWIIGGDTGITRNDVWYSQDGIDWTRVTEAAQFNDRDTHSSLIYTAPATVSTIDVAVNTGTDDAEHAPGGWPNYSDTSSGIFAGSPSGNTVWGGFRWTGVGLPADAVITEAYVQLFQSEDAGHVFETTLSFEKNASPPTFSAGNTPFDRWASRTTFEVDWTAPWAWGEADTWRQTPSLTAGIQELVDTFGVIDEIVLMEDGTGVSYENHDWGGYDFSPGEGAQLHIEYTSGGGVDAMWIFGGSNAAPGKFNDTWYSTDGSTWTQAAANAQWRERSRLDSLVFDDGAGKKLWIIGGSAATAGDCVSGINECNDVWYSIDGITWTQATANAQWEARKNPAALVFDSKMWIIGGNTPGSNLNDAWYSTDGITWTQATAGAQWQGRVNHAAVVYGSSMWILGGDTGVVLQNDVWYSTDGINWTQGMLNAEWERRRRHGAEVFNDQMWIFGGLTDTTYVNDVWSYNPSVDWDGWIKLRGTTIHNVSSLHTLTSLITSTDSSDPRAPEGVRTETATFENTSTVPLVDLHFEVTLLAPPEDVLLNADGGPGGTGSTVSVPPFALGPDGILSPGESFVQVFEIGLYSLDTVDFYVDIHGTSGPSAVSYVPSNPDDLFLVTWDPVTQELQGWAWGSEVVGWVSFNCLDLGVCATTDYKVVVHLNTPPEAQTLSFGTLDYCFAPYPPIVLSWTFSDPDAGDSQSAYQVQVDDNLDFSSPEVDSGKVLSGSTTYAPPGLLFATEYYWRVQVWDSRDEPSGWVYPPSPAGFPTAAPGTSFLTQQQYPNPSVFDWIPDFPAAEEEVQFNENTTFSGVPGVQSWAWDFETDGITDSTLEDPTHIYPDNQTYSVTLQACADGTRCCSSTQSLRTNIPFPDWREISPF